MKKSISILTMAVLIGAGFSACNTTEENEAPTITFESPDPANNPYMSGAQFHIHINYADDSELHEITLTAIREHDTTEVYHTHQHPDAATFTLEVDTVFTTTEHSDFTFTATATDHEEKSTTVAKTIHMHPM